eukprot:scaffold115731_cov63-Attheya_sp.AAC.1
MTSLWTPQKSALNRAFSIARERLEILLSDFMEVSFSPEAPSTTCISLVIDEHDTDKAFYRKTMS